MRLKKVKGSRETVINSEYVINNPESYKGKWSSVFKNSNFINIEIGMGKGKFIIEMAKKNPDINFIGIEMYDSVLVRAVQKLQEIEECILNLKLIRMDAEKIENIFEGEISKIYLNFSDPWPKKKHAKRRLTSVEFLRRYDNIFKGEKVIFQKTDNNELFDFSIESLTLYGYTLKKVTRNFR